MAFHVAWSEDKRVVFYIADGEWNWRDYHTAVRASLFALSQREQSVDSVVDFRRNARAKLPAGLAAHVRSFGKRHHPKLTGRALVIAFPPEGEAALDLDEQRQLSTPDGFVRFVDDVASAQALIEQWRAEEDQG